NCATNASPLKPNAAFFEKSNPSDDECTPNVATGFGGVFGCVASSGGTCLNWFWVNAKSPGSSGRMYHAPSLTAHYRSPAPETGDRPRSPNPLSDTKCRAAAAAASPEGFLHPCPTSL